MKITVSSRDKIFRRKHDGALFGDTIELGIDWSTGIERQDNSSYYEEIDSNVKIIPISYNIEESQLPSIVQQFPEWRVGLKLYAAEGERLADVVGYKDLLYKIVQTHTTQLDWLPDLLPALYTPFRPITIILAWKQPLGAQDAYQIGDKVTYNGFTWQSTAANNVWQPGVYGWVKI